MGQATGKLTLHHVPDKRTTETNDLSPHEKVNVRETASQLVNGDASVMNNVPAIDDVVEPASGKSIEEPVHEVSQTVDEAPGPNGSVHADESANIQEAEKKKSKNPLGWIKRRLSKKASTTKEPVQPETAPTDEQGDSPKELKAEEATEASAPVSTTHDSVPSAIPEAQITGTAQSLVDEVISSAVSGEQEQVVHSPEASAVLTDELQISPERNIVGESFVQLEEEEEEEEEKIEEPVECPIKPEPEPIVETHPVAEEHLEQEMPLEEESFVPVVDTNNTNVTNDDTLDEMNDTHASEELDEAISSKLSELELTNGHQEQCPPKENGYSAGHEELEITDE